MGKTELWHLGVESIKELETEQGILASGREELYGCLFGRDSLITALELLAARRHGAEDISLPLIRKILYSLAELQGTETNIESGEEPGKIIHEFRPDRHEHLTALTAPPWYVYPDGTMRNYDSIDSTLLYLLALNRYGETTGDYAFLEDLLPSAKAALGWTLAHSDTFITYAFPPERTHGGLQTQSWMDSTESLFYEHSDARPPYPIAPLEAQAYAWATLKGWGDYFKGIDSVFSARLSERADDLKRRFNAAYVLIWPRSISLAFALDGDGRRLLSARSSMGHVLWAAHQGAEEAECILENRYIPDIVDRLMRPDLFVSSAGIRTLSSRSKKYDPMSYHNGSIWPHDTALIAEGLDNFGYTAQAARVREGLLKSYSHFRTPIELFAYKRKRYEYESPSGQRACRVQAWSAAGLLATLAAGEMAQSADSSTIDG